MKSISKESLLKLLEENTRWEYFWGEDESQCVFDKRWKAFDVYVVEEDSYYNYTFRKNFERKGKDFWDSFTIDYDTIKFWKNGKVDFEISVKKPVNVEDLA